MAWQRKSLVGSPKKEAQSAKESAKADEKRRIRTGNLLLRAEKLAVKSFCAAQDCQAYGQKKRLRTIAG